VRVNGLVSDVRVMVAVPGALAVMVTMPFPVTAVATSGFELVTTSAGESYTDRQEESRSGISRTRVRS